MPLYTNLINQLGLAVASSAVPTLPAYGSNLTLSDPWEANPFVIDDKAFDIVEVKEDVVPIKAPKHALKTSEHRFDGAIERVDITSFEIGQEAYQWASNFTRSGAVFTPRNSGFTRMALIIEIYGECLMYFPSVNVIMGPPQGAGVKTKATVYAHFNVFRLASHPFGYDIHQYQVA